MLTGGNLYSVSSRSLLADVQLLGLLHLEHGRRCVRNVSTRGTSWSTTSSRWNAVASRSVSTATRTSRCSVSTVVAVSSSSWSTRSGTSWRNVARTVRTSMVGHSSGGRSVGRVLLLTGLAEAGSHFLAAGTAWSRSHLWTARYPVELWLEIKVVLRGVKFLLDEVRPRERWHVALVELIRARASGIGPHKVLSGAAKLVAELIRVGRALTLGTLRPTWWESDATHAAHGILVLVLFGHVLQGLCRRGQFRHGPVLRVSVRTPFRA